MLTRPAAAGGCTTAAPLRHCTDYVVRPTGGRAGGPSDLGSTLILPRHRRLVVAPRCRTRTAPWPSFSSPFLLSSFNADRNFIFVQSRSSPPPSASVGRPRRPSLASLSFRSSEKRRSVAHTREFVDQKRMSTTRVLTHATMSLPTSRWTAVTHSVVTLSVGTISHFVTQDFSVGTLSVLTLSTTRGLYPL